MDPDVIGAGDAETIASALARRFTELHGRHPLGCYRAPGRVNLIGEHLDYNGGLVLPVALPHATYAAAAARDDQQVHITSLQQDQPFHGRLDALGPGEVTGWAAYAAGVLWAMRDQDIDVPGVDLVVDSRVPVGAGLSSSAALECSVAMVGCAVAGLEVDDDVRAQLVQACMRAEQEVAGAATGGMDQTVAMFAQLGHALLLDCRDWSREQVPWSPRDAGVSLLVVNTRASHTLNDGGYESRRRDCETAARSLGVDLLRDVTDPAAALAALDDPRVRRRARHVFTEGDRVERGVGQIRAGDYAGLGATFTASHASMRDDFEISCSELDVTVDTALHHGALGARMTGGGFGGSAIALVPSEHTAAVEQAVTAAFAEHGWDSPGFLTAPASGAAGPVPSEV
jgi:galactokinase